MERFDDEGDHDIRNRGEALGAMLHTLCAALKVPERTSELPLGWREVRVFLPEGDDELLERMRRYFGVPPERVVWMAMALELSLLGDHQAEHERLTHGG